jgi:hypothetical protein
MARIQGATQEQVISIKKFLGVNENPDGDTKLKLGEAISSLNWRITKDNHLQKRPGYGVFADLGDTPVLGAWCGYVNKELMFVASCGCKLWKIDGDAPVEIGDVEGDHAHFFGFDEKLYLLTGSKYYVYDGETLREVEGYRPLVATAVPPTGGGTQLEQINLLNGKRRALFSPDGTAKVFQLPETNLASIDYVKNVADGTDISYSSVDLSAGTVTFNSAPAAGTNTIEIGWTVSENGRSIIEAMRFSETYNGPTDSRVFLYGDGSNKAYYSGLDINNKPTAEYFPALNEVAVDSANTPITAMIRHFNSLLAFKPDGAFSITYDTITLENGVVTAGFYVVPMNREIGHVAPGQAVLVKNNPYTLFGRSVYEWRLSSFAKKDERAARQISDRVWNTLAGLDLTKAICFDDEYNTEYYICQGGTAVVYNYTADAWYIYDNIPSTCFITKDGSLYFGTPDGKIMRFSRDFRNDNGMPISTYWESGSIDFGADFRLKHTSDIWVSLKPESQARVTVTIQSNRKSVYTEKAVSSSLATFSHMDFSHFSFATNRKP